MLATPTQRNLPDAYSAQPLQALFFLRTGLHAPLDYGPPLYPGEDHVEGDSDERYSHQAREHVWYPQEVAGVVYEVAQTPASSGDAEDQLGRDDRAPPEGPAGFEPANRVRQPVLTLIAMGHVTALAMTKTSAAGLRPNQSIASGRIAIAGSGLSIEVNSTSTSSPMRVHVAKVVSTAARHIPTSIPRPSISRVTSVAAASSPLAQPSQNASAIFAGLETSSGLTPETDTYSCQSKTIATSSIERRATVGSEDHLSLEVLFRALGAPGVVEEAFTSLEDCMIHILPFIGQKLAQMPSRFDKLFRIRVFYVTYVHDLLYLRGRVAEYHYAVTDQKRFLDAVGHEQYRHASSGRDLVQLFL